jgi:hypothetical protein
MVCRKALGYFAYPILAACFLAGQQGWGQAPAQPDTQQQPAQAPGGTDTQGQAQTPSGAQPDAGQQQPAGASQSNPYPNEQQRVQLARQAQERLRARLRQRTETAIHDTYSRHYEVTGGYTFMRLQPGHYLAHVSEGGWFGEFTDYVSDHWGITGDARGLYGSAFIGPYSPIRIFEPSISNYGFMGGPQYRFIMGKTWGVSGQVLAGISRNLFYADSNDTPGTLVGLYPINWKFSWEAGVPIDLNLSPALAVRVTPMVYTTTWGGDTQYSRGFTGGLTYRWGRR